MNFGASKYPRFVPGLLRSATEPGRLRSLGGISISVDVAGFTALSERLHAHGTEGCEELTVLLGRFFEPAIGAILSAGGDVLGFAGDSMLATFPDARRRAQSVEAMAAAHDVLDVAGRLTGVETLVGSVNLGVRIGIGTGSVDLAVAGEPDGELRVVVTGDGIAAAVAAQEVAGLGTIKWVDSGDRRGLPGAELQPSDDGPVRDELFARFVPQAVAARIAAGGRDLIDEHRRVTTLFVGLRSGSGMDDVIDAVPIALDAARHFDGALLNIDCTDKGAALLLTFGTPVTHREDPERAVACAHELAGRLVSPIRVGVATGRCFSGIVGSNVRASYTVFGDSVNLAARLMQLAEPGQVLSDGPTREEAGGAFRWGAAKELRLKGKELTVAVAALASVTQSRRLKPAVPSRLIGRRAEIETLRHAWREARSGQGRSIVVSGPAGVGKSRLAQALVEEATAEGARIASGGFELTTSRSPYFGLRPVWRQVLELGDPPSPARLERYLSGFGDEAQALIPVLSAALGLSTDRPTDSEGVGGDALHALLLQALATGARSVPWLLVVDDVQWSDPASRDLLAFIADRISDISVLIVLLSRDEGIVPTGPTARVGGLALGVLDESDAEQLAAELLGAPGADAARLAHRSGGNPLFLDELVRRRAVGEGDELSDTLAGLVQSTIDGLSPRDQTTIKAASVLGRSFRVSDLLGAFADDLNGGARASVASLSTIGLLPRVEHASHAEHAFRSDTLQEVAYGSLSHASRRRLHEAAGGWFEREHATDLDSHLDLIAYHYGRSANLGKQETYFASAGRRAADLFANDAAIDYLERLRALPGRSSGEALLRELGQLYAHVGRQTEAEARLRAAVESAEPKPDPRCLAALGRLLAEQLRLDEASTVLARARSRAEDDNSDAAWLAVFAELPVVFGQRHEFARAEELAREHLRFACQCRDPVAEATARLHIAVNVNDQGRIEEADRELHRAHALVADQPGALRWRIESTLFLVGERRADLRNAVAWLQRAQDTARLIGHEPGLVLNLGDEGNLRFLLGDVPGAVVRFREALDLALPTGQLRAIVQALLILAGTSEGGLPPEGYYDRAEAVARLGGDERDVTRVLLERAQAAVGSGAFDAAEDALLEATSGSTAMPIDVNDQAEIQRAAMGLRHAEHEHDEAVAALRAMVDGATLERDRIEALTLLTALDPDDVELHDEATRAVQDLYLRVPYLAYRLAYQDLTGELLPEIHILEPAEILPGMPSVRELIDRVDALIESLRVPAGASAQA